MSPSIKTHYYFLINTAIKINKPNKNVHAFIYAQNIISNAVQHGPFMTEYCDDTTDHTRRLSWDSVVTVGLVLCLLHFPT